MIFMFVEPTPTGVMLDQSGRFPALNLKDDCSIQDMLGGLYDHYGVEMQGLVPVGTINKHKVIAVAAHCNPGLLRSGPPANNAQGLVHAMVRSALSDWRIETKGPNDFNIQFLGS